jgi:hypothetical protein
LIDPGIVPSDRSGGTNTSHTIIVPALTHLLSVVDRDATPADYEQAVVADNVLGKETAGSRSRTLRYLRELYLLRPNSILFRSLRDLWTDDVSGQPLIAGLCALARDAVFRASSPVIFESNPGDEVTSADLAEAVEKAFPTAYSPSTIAKVGRNTFSSWEQSGHLEGMPKGVKSRRRPTCTASATAYALLLGHLEGVRGAALFDTFWAKVLDQPRSHLMDLAFVASQRSLIDFKNSGGVTAVNFTELLRPMEGQLL